MLKFQLKLFALMLVFSLSLLGCSSRGPAAGGASPAPAAGTSSNNAATPATKPTPAPTASAGAKKISWYVNTSDTLVQNAYKELSDSFKKENPNIDVEIRFPGSELKTC